MENTVRQTLLWLTKDKDKNLPSLRLRILKLEPFLKDHFDQTLAPAPLSFIQLARLIPQIRKVEIVVIQKQLISPLFLFVVRLLAKKLYFDFDDSVHIRHTKNGEHKYSRKCLARFRLICKVSDAIIAGNSILKTKAEECGAKIVHILPTALPVQNRSAKTDHKLIVNLGWIGTAANLVYLEKIETVFLRLETEGRNFQLSVMADRPPAFRQFTHFNFIKWSAEGELEFLSSIDIGLMPLLDNEHTRGKCAYKALQYMSFEKPVVVSDVGINAVWTKGAGYAVGNDEEMLESIIKLMESEELRRKLGEAGREIIEKYFSEEIISQRLVDILTHPELVNPHYPAMQTQSAS